MRLRGTASRSLAIAACLLSTSSALAQTVRYELDGEVPLTDAGWTFIESGSTKAFGTEGLRLQSNKGYAEWMLRSAPDKPKATTGWLADVKAGRGWWLEARVQVTTASNCTLSGPGLWVDDGKSFLQLFVDTAGAHLVGMQRRDFALSSGGYHVYRVRNLGARHFQLLIDGVVVVDDPALPTQGTGAALMFGDLGGCDATDTTWDYVAYDAFGPGSAPGDDDNDLVANAQDNCVLLANAQQADADHDGVGDECDVCPEDAGNDQDNDGTCANQDPCPSDPRNDRDMDGVCDTEQCAPFQPGSYHPQGCPLICNCPLVGYDDPRGGFGNLDNFGGTYGIGAGGTSGSTGSSTSRAGSHGGGYAGRDSATGLADPTSDDPASQAAASDAAGCGCRLSSSRSSATGAWLALAGLALGVAGRRRARLGCVSR